MMMIKDGHDIRVTGYTKFPARIYDVSDQYWGGAFNAISRRGVRRFASKSWSSKKSSIDKTPFVEIVDSKRPLSGLVRSLMESKAFCC